MLWKKLTLITKNPAGLPLLTVTYTYNDHVVVALPDITRPDSFQTSFSD